MGKFNTGSFVAKAIKVHGNKYDYSKSVYVKAKEKVEIICEEHGSFFMTPNNHHNGKGCPKCGDIQCSLKQRKTLEEFISKASEVHCGKYDYSFVEYTNDRTHVTIVCPIHGKFTQAAGPHALGRAGCPKCPSNALKTTEQFIKECREKHGDFFDYHLTNYVTKKIKVKIICPKHGVIEMLPDGHLKGHGCRKCANDALSVSHTGTQEEFLVASSKYHGDFYDYSRAVFKGDAHRVDIICPVHGLFRQVAGAHKKGCGCPSCAKSGYSIAKPGWLYIMQSDNCLKVGITNKKPAVRAKSITRSSGMHFKVTAAICFADGRIPNTVENKVLEELRGCYRQPIEKFDGSTECFYNVCFTSLLQRIGFLASETFNELNKE